MTMNLSDLIKEHEGLMLKPYHCSAGKLTIGYGRNLEARGISLNEAEYLLANDIRDCRESLTRDYSWFAALDQVRQAALVDLVFNMGANRLAGFVKFLVAMARSDWPRAAEELRNSRWYGQVGRRAERVIWMIERGEWP
jgi:lysozyme